MFVSGPTGTRVTFSGLFLIVFMYHVTKFSGTGFVTVQFLHDYLTLALFMAQGKEAGQRTALKV